MLVMARKTEPDWSVTIDVGADWVVEMQWLKGETQGGPAALVIRPSDPECYPAGGLSSTVLREIDFRYAAERLRKQLAFHDRWNKADKNYEAKRMDRVRAALAEGITEQYLALLASVYVHRVNIGQDKPVQQLADELGKSLTTVKGHLWQARKRGLLTGSSGRKGGQLTPEATKILERIVPIDGWHRELSESPDRLLP
jgi:hypothetical protein